MNKYYFYLCCVFTLIVFIVTPTTVQAIDPPSGTGSASQCHTGRSSQRAVNESLNISIGTGTETNKCRTGGGTGSGEHAQIVHLGDRNEGEGLEERLTVRVSQNLSTILPTEILVEATLYYPLAGIKEDFSYTLSGQQIYEEHSEELEQSWTEVNLPWTFDSRDLSYLEEKYEVTFTITSTFMDDGIMNDAIGAQFVEVNQQQLTFTSVVIGDEEVVVPVFKTVDTPNISELIHSFSAYPNPSPNGILTLNFDVNTLKTQTQLEILDEEGNLLHTTTAFSRTPDLLTGNESFKIVFDLNELCEGGCPSNRVFIFRVTVIDRNTRATDTQSERIIIF